jgi:hypothetical protein
VYTYDTSRPGRWRISIVIAERLGTRSVKLVECTPVGGSVSSIVNKPASGHTVKRYVSLCGSTRICLSRRIVRCKQGFNCIHIVGYATCGSIAVRRWSTAAPSCKVLCICDIVFGLSVCLHVGIEFRSCQRWEHGSWILASRFKYYCQWFAKVGSGCW